MPICQHVFSMATKNVQVRSGSGRIRNSGLRIRGSGINIYIHNTATYRT